VTIIETKSLLCPLKILKNFGNGRNGDYENGEDLYSYHE
jgi:hypothetical protein